MEEFTDWLEQELQSRDWSVSDLARKAGVQPASLSRILNKTRKAGPDICRAVAEAFHVSPEKVFRKAGLLPPTPEKDPTILDAIHKMSRLTQEEREEIVRYMDFVISRHQGEAAKEETSQKKGKART
jgi:transcriptional regulator with XRE-family HTH domain